MDAYTISVLTQLHIDDLHRENSSRRLARIGRKHKNQHPATGAIRLQRVPAP